MWFFQDVRPSQDLKNGTLRAAPYETLGVAFMVTGAVITAAGGALLIWEMMGAEKETDGTHVFITPVLTADGPGFAARLSF